MKSDWWRDAYHTSPPPGSVLAHLWLKLVATITLSTCSIYVDFKPVCEVEHFYWGDVYVYNFACIPNQITRQCCKMVFYFHGTMSLVNDQIKTVAEGVLRVCIPCTRMMNKNHISMGEFQKLHYRCLRQVFVS